jgi:hypothetical protein
LFSGYLNDVIKEVVYLKICGEIAEDGHKHLLESLRTTVTFQLHYKNVKSLWKVFKKCYENCPISEMILKNPLQVDSYTKRMFLLPGGSRNKTMKEQ